VNAGKAKLENRIALHAQGYEITRESHISFSYLHVLNRKAGDKSKSGKIIN